MTFGRFSDPLVSGWLDEIYTKSLFGALFYDNPFATDPLTVEVVGGGYARPALTHERLASNTLTHSNLLVWHNLPPGTHIAWVGCFDDDTGGVLQAAASLNVAVDLVSGGTWSVGAEQFVMGLDVSTGP